MKPPEIVPLHIPEGVVPEPTLADVVSALNAISWRQQAEAAYTERDRRHRENYVLMACGAVYGGLIVYFVMRKLA